MYLKHNAIVLTSDRSFSKPTVFNKQMFVEAANVDSRGIRSWVAKGRRGEIYLSFFNLTPEKTTVSANISKLAALFFPQRKFSKASCKYREIWSKKDFGIAKEETISISINEHGCALFVLNYNWL
ncbi:hypothetical protein C5167_023282 [Papaver somniferum]|uniref:Alpha galactosidase C-terminal domain-containing protein n=1 Tax=Papaver somniferum TaxID=3469 RepID=A0A4Y7JK80_PAPSO|nr:hypothetical protein C5167_023282 [Papaver somniferum]